MYHVCMYVCRFRFRRTVAVCRSWRRRENWRWSSRTIRSLSGLTCPSEHASSVERLGYPCTVCMHVCLYCMYVCMYVCVLYEWVIWNSCMGVTVCMCLFFMCVEAYFVSMYVCKYVCMCTVCVGYMNLCMCMYACTYIFHVWTRIM